MRNKNYKLEWAPFTWFTVNANRTACTRRGNVNNLYGTAGDRQLNKERSEGMGNWASILHQD